MHHRNQSTKYQLVLILLFFTSSLFYAQKPVLSISEKPKLRVLVFSGTGWYRHVEIPAMNGWLVRLGSEEAMKLNVSERAVDISAKTLANYNMHLLNK